jgi:hypothetical protein
MAMRDARLGIALPRSWYRSTVLVLLDLEYVVIISPSLCQLAAISDPHPRMWLN